MMLVIHFHILGRSLDQYLSDKINQPGEPLADNLELWISGEIPGPVPILVPVGHEVKLSGLYFILAPVGFHCLEVVFGVAILVFDTGGVLCVSVELAKWILEVLELLSNKLLEVVTLTYKKKGT